MELTRNLRKDPVSRLEATVMKDVDESASVADAVSLMRHERVGCVLVTTDGKLVGLFTERDLMRRVLAVGKSLDTPIRDVMTRKLVTIHPKDNIRAAIRRMKLGGYRHLPVVDDSNRAIGVLSVKRIIHYLVEHYPSAVYNQPQNPNDVPNEAEGA